MNQDRNQSGNRAAFVSSISSRGSGNSGNGSQPNRAGSSSASSSSLLSRLPRGLSISSVNRLKLGVRPRSFPNPFASRSNILKRLKSGETRGFLSSSRPRYAPLPPRLPAITTQELRKQVERRYQERAAKEEAGNESAGEKISPEKRSPNLSSSGKSLTKPIKLEETVVQEVVLSSDEEEKEIIISQDSKGRSADVQVKKEPESEIVVESAKANSSSASGVSKVLRDPRGYSSPAETSFSFPMPRNNGKGLLPTPTIKSSVFQRLGGQDTADNRNKNFGGAKNSSGNGGGVWRTYYQEKQLSDFGDFTSFKKMHQRKGIIADSRSSANKMQPKPQKSQTDDYDSSAKASSSTASAETKAAFDPFARLPLSAAPTSASICEMYESMLRVGATDARMQNQQNYEFQSQNMDVNFEDLGWNTAGSFVKTNSKYGNSIIPVLPRLSPPPPNN